MSRLSDLFNFKRNDEDLFTKKNIITLLVMGIAVLIIPAAYRLLQTTQIFQSRAAGEVVTFVGSNIGKDADGNWTTTSDTVSIDLRSPLGPPGVASSPTPTRTTTPTRTSSVTPTRTSSVTPTRIPTPTSVSGYRLSNVLVDSAGKVFYQLCSSAGFCSSAWKQAATAALPSAPVKEVDAFNYGNKIIITYLGADSSRFFWRECPNTTNIMESATGCTSWQSGDKTSTAYPAANQLWSSTDSFDYVDKNGQNFLQSWVQSDNTTFYYRTCPVTSSGINWGGCANWAKGTYAARIAQGSGSFGTQIFRVKFLSNQQDYETSTGNYSNASITGPDWNSFTSGKGNTSTGNFPGSRKFTGYGGFWVKIAPPPTPTSTKPPTPTPTPVGKTTHYKIVEAATQAEAVEKFKAAPELPYSNATKTDPVRAAHKFTSDTPGFKILYFQFIDHTVTPARTQIHGPVRIRLLGGKPSITQVQCTYDAASGEGTLVTINGHNFGPQNNQGVNVASQSATILSWKDQGSGGPSPTASTPFPTKSLTPTSKAPSLPPKIPSKNLTPTSEVPSLPPRGPSPTGPRILGATTTNSQIKARISSRPSGTIKVMVTTLDGQTASGTCRIGLTTLDFTSTLQCRPREVFNASDVDVTVIEGTPSAKPLVNQKVDFDTDGRPIDFAPILEVGKKYYIKMKAPQALAKRVNFTALDGTTVLPNIYLPIGDIFPLDFTDGSINSLDKSELIREWLTLLVEPNTVENRAADFNLDGRVNSIDYSCMLLNFNKSDDK